MTEQRNHRDTLGAGVAPDKFENVLSETMETAPAALSTAVTQFLLTVQQRNSRSGEEGVLNPFRQLASLLHLVVSRASQRIVMAGENDHAGL